MIKLNSNIASTLTENKFVAYGKGVYRKTTIISGIATEAGYDFIPRSQVTEIHLFAHKEGGMLYIVGHQQCKFKTTEEIAKYL